MVREPGVGKSRLFLYSQTVVAIYRATIPHWQGRFQEVIAILEPQAAVCRERKSSVRPCSP